MNRSRKIMLLCHCILNCCSKVEGCSTYNGAMPEITKALVDSGMGLLQLPCPEITMYGIKRWGHVKSQFDNPYYRKHCRKLLTPYIEQITDYTKNGYQIAGLLGIEGSPSCGIVKSCIANWGGEFSSRADIVGTLGSVELTNAKGIFIEEMEGLMKISNIEVPFLGIDESDFELSLKRLIQFMRRQ